ncbi:hypothetical protein ACQUW5_12100 [Legionella sp. CNM-1927-20]|uniref:hypothetical protein n=1 Tax=Legionella sp. CNM-1927-20 TaxID=3422221 RepID=UPI00403B17E2
MPLSPTFIKLFSELTTNYQQKARGSLLSYGRDSHFDNLKINLESILTIIEHSNKDDNSFDDMSLLSVLSITATRFSATDPIFANLVSSLIDKYYKLVNYNTYLTEQGMLIKVNPEARYSINALSELQHAFGNLQKAHQSEKTMLLDQIKDLQREKNVLKEQNDYLRKQVNTLESSKNQWEKLSSAKSIIEKIKDAAASLNTLIEPESLLTLTISLQEPTIQENKNSAVSLPNGNPLPVNGSPVKIMESLIPPPPKLPEPIPPRNTPLALKDNKDTKLTTPKEVSETKKHQKNFASGLTFRSELDAAIKKREDNKKNKQYELPSQEKKNTLRI